MPAVDISMPTSVIRSSLGAVQSFVLHPKFMAGDLLTVGCLEERKVNLPVRHRFRARSVFDSWTDVSRHPRVSFYRSPFQCYTACYLRQVEEWRPGCQLLVLPLVRFRRLVKAQPVLLPNQRKVVPEHLGLVNRLEIFWLRNFVEFYPDDSSFICCYV